MIVDQATAALDPLSRSAVKRGVVSALDGRGLVWVLPDVAGSEGFDRVIVMAHGRVSEQDALKRGLAPAASPRHIRKSPATRKLLR